MDLGNRKRLVLLVITCALGALSGCEKGCEKSKPEQVGVLKPVQTENAEKSVSADLPTGIESPAVKSEKANDSTRHAGATAEPASNQAVAEKTSPTEAISSPKVSKKTVTNATKQVEKTRTTASAAQASVFAPPAPVATPVAPEVKAEPKAATKVVVPGTKNVRVEVPAGLQRLLDDDPRMQPWVNKVLEVAEQCYAKERGYNSLAKGVITANITMHQNERPDASMGSLPPMLAGVVACATGKLARTRMPFFTGDEGAKYTVRFHFTR